MLPHKECFQCVLVFWYLRSPPKKHSKYMFLGVSFCFSVKGFFACILSFYYVRDWETLKTHVFGNVVCFFTNSALLALFEFWYLKILKKILILHVSGNVLFLHIGCFVCILAFCQTWGKTWRKTIILNVFYVVLFFYIKILFTWFRVLVLKLKSAHNARYF